MRRTLRLLCAAVCLALALTACSQPVPDPVPTATPVPTPTQTPQALRFSLGYDPAAQLHPITGDSQVNQELTGLVYQGLYELDNAFQPQPVLAASGNPSEDGYRWTFTIRAGALFSDGSPLTAQHAAASLNAARTSTLYAARLSGVASVSAADELTLVVALSAPNGGLPALLDIPVVLEQEEGPPLGSGCYRYESAGDRLFLQTNPYHEGAAALPYATIPLTAVSDAAQRIAAFDSGNITAVTTDFSSPYALGYASSYEACDYPTTSLLYVGFQAAGGRANLHWCAGPSPRCWIERKWRRCFYPATPTRLRFPSPRCPTNTTKLPPRSSISTWRAPPPYWRRRDTPKTRRTACSTTGARPWLSPYW